MSKTSPLGGVFDFEPYAILTLMKRWERQTGFTIVELLIVVVVIAILAAITIVAYTGVQARAQASSAQSDLRQFAQIMEIQKTQSSTDTYPSILTSDMGIKFTKSIYGLDNQNKNVRFCYNSANNQYIMYVSTKSGKYFQYIGGGTGLTETYYVHGYSICSRIGLTNTNPSQDGVTGTNWAAWVN